MTPTKIGSKLGAEGLVIANKMHSVGWCFKAVAEAVGDIVAEFLYGHSAYMAADEIAARDDFKEYTS